MQAIARFTRIISASLAKTKFGLLAFAVTFGVRALPEILAWPYAIGYDTIGSYIPFMLDWGSGNYATFTPSTGGWLLYSILGLAYSFARIDPILIAKTTGPLLYGLLGLSEYYFASRGLQWSSGKSLLPVIVGSFYFVSLRLSLDLFRNTLGLSLLLVSLTLSLDIKSRVRLVTFALVAWLTTIAHLLAATILIGIVFLVMLRIQKQRRWRMIGLLPCLLQYGLSLFSYQSNGTPLFSAPNSSINPLIAYAFPLYIFGPLLPIAIIGVIKTGNLILKAWVVVCIAGIALTITPVSTSFQLVMADRWSLMLMIPLLIYSTEGLSILLKKEVPRVRPRLILPFAWLGLLVLLGTAYIALPAESSFQYYQYFTPTSMLQSTVSITDSSHVVAALQWLSTNLKTDSVLMTHHAFYGWARAYFHSNTPIVGYDPSTTLVMATQLTQRLGYASIYTIWWTNGHGWYGQPSVPSGFSLQFASGSIGVFLYVG